MECWQASENEGVASEVPGRMRQLRCLLLLLCGVVLVPGTAEGRLVTGFAPCPQSNPPAAECIVSLLVDLRPFRIKGSKSASLPQPSSSSASTTQPPPHQPSTTAAAATTPAMTTATSVTVRPSPTPASVSEDEVQLQLLNQQRRYELQLREQQWHQQQLERQLHRQGEELRFLKEQVRQLLQLLGSKAALDVPQRADEIVWERSRS